MAHGEKNEDGNDRGNDGIVGVCRNEDGEAASGEKPGGGVNREGVVWGGDIDGFEFFEAVVKINFPQLDMVDEVVDFPEATEVVIAGLNSFDVDELVKFIFFPEGTGEGGGAHKKVAVQSEHFCDVFEVSFDAFAGRATFMQGAPEFDDKAGALAKAVLFGRHAVL